MKPLILIATVGAVALPWYVAVSVKTDGAWLSGFLGQHNLGRFTSAMEGHRGPVFYYVPVILVGFFPWSVVLPACLVESWRCSRSQERDHRGVTFLLCWTVVYVVFFSIAQTKLPNYVLPCYPAMALLTARAIVRWSERTIQVPAWVPKLGLGSLIVAGGLLGVALPAVSSYFLPGYAALGAIGIVPLLAGGIAWWWSRQEQRHRALQILGVGAVGLMVVVFSWMVPWISQAQESPVIGRTAAAIARGEGRIATYRYFAPNLPFYSKQRVERLKRPEEVSDLLAAADEVVLCLKAEDYAELADALGDRLVVRQRIDRFLRKEQILVVARKKPLAAVERDRTKLVENTAFQTD